MINLLLASISSILHLELCTVLPIIVIVLRLLRGSPVSTVTSTILLSSGSTSIAEKKEVVKTCSTNLESRKEVKLKYQFQNLLWHWGIAGWEYQAVAGKPDGHFVFPDREQYQYTLPSFHQGHETSSLMIWNDKDTLRITLATTTHGSGRMNENR